jgi:NAD(P)-dependent dehydrogenase (short-subunit alcohol dehydrogenase family)
MMQGKTVGVVGGTSGMGFATAEKSAKAGANVIIFGRSQEKVQKAKERLGNNVQVRKRYVCIFTLTIGYRCRCFQSG